MTLGMFDVRQGSASYPASYPVRFPAPVFGSCSAPMRLRMVEPSSGRRSHLHPEPGRHCRSERPWPT